jgi:ABC-type polysaccharide/polyol phosphate transport system ATPase subunit
VIGPNGAGKTTLLRVIAGIFPPTLGSFTCRGRVVPLLELGLGFNGELTGAENVVLAGVLLGQTRKQAKSAIGRIMEFAGLEDFTDVPVKCYSSGMAARLAFSVAMETEPDVLLLDEVFAVGDIHWIRQAEERILALLNRAEVVIMVSHNPAFLRRLCHRGIYLEHGQMMAEGPIDAVVDAYETHTGTGGSTVVDNRDKSMVRLAVRHDGHTLHVEATALPLLGECWLGIFAPAATRNEHLAWHRVSPDRSSASFVIEPDRPYQVRLYRWSPGGETLEASFDVGPTAR